MFQPNTNIFLGPPTQKTIEFLPKWFCNQSLLTFFVAFALCSIVYGYVMEVRYAVIASISTILFFYGGKELYHKWRHLSGKTYVKQVVLIGLFVRLLWVAYCYFYFNEDYYGVKMGDTADCEWYLAFGKAIAMWIQNGFNDSFSHLLHIWQSALDDCGYPFWLAIEYLVVGVENDVFVPMIVKCVVSALCTKYIYNIGKRHFGEQIARVAAIFVALNPNMIYWCGTMFKESEMVFLVCLFVDEMDKALGKDDKLTFKALLPATLIGMSLFFFRSALGLVAFLAMFAHMVFASKRIISLGKKVLAGTMVAIALLIGMGDTLRTQSQHVVQSIQSDKQQTNMEWRGNREGGNQFAKYAGAAVFAPLILTIPFPTFNVALESQILQRELSGGSFIKNILSFFVILILFVFLFSGEWRRHVFIIAYLCGYLAALVFSEFAQSGRFHLPIIPFIMLFGAYGINYVQQNKKWKKYWPLVLVIEVIFCLGWNWFKLAGRGLI